MLNGQHKFTLGRLLATPGALAALDEAGQTPLEIISRHVSGDWGDVSPSDKELNDQALIDGSRILSAYKTRNNVKVWVISDACDNHGRRAATTILKPDEY
ncbi:MAG: hypothetical protein ACYC4U_15905 [Pirellulaceae bacterium]